MQKPVSLIILVFVSLLTFGQASVGIGTASPNSKAILELSSVTQVFLPPRMDSGQMMAIGTPPIGSLIYNTTLHTPMTYARMGFRTTLIPRVFASNNKWFPVSPGPKVLAWGFVDTTSGNENTVASAAAPIKSGSGNFRVIWYGRDPAGKKWYQLSINNDNFSKDSMMLMITPVGNGSWDVTVSIGEVVDGTDVDATIKFTDMSRVDDGWTILDRRRKSAFYFVLYDLRGY